MSKINPPIKSSPDRFHSNSELIRKSLSDLYGGAHVDKFVAYANGLSDKIESSFVESKILDSFRRMGYICPAGAAFWRIKSVKDGYTGLYGMQIGRYSHSCHIDSTDFIVLLIMHGNSDSTCSFSDFWLEKAFTI